VTLRREEKKGKVFIMKKMVLIFAVLLMAVPAMGKSIVTINCVPGVEVNEVNVSYTITGTDPNLVRGFGLTIEAENANITKILWDSDGPYRIFPGQIHIDYGEITDYNYPYEQEDLGDSNLTVEMGSLYTFDANYGPGGSKEDPNAGYDMQPGLSGNLFRFYVNRSDNKYGYEIVENARRGGIVMENPDEDPCVILCKRQLDYDFGDAPDEPYPTLLVSNGARHIVSTEPVGPILGYVRDVELNGQPNADATGDDISGVPDDEDGVTNLVATLAGGSVDVYVSADCNLNAWIDFNNDGDWADVNEQIFTDEELTGPGTNSLTFGVPADACTGIDLFSRWRVSTKGGDSYTGLAQDGEVEDYNKPKIEGGVPPCHVPDVVGDPCDEAKATLITAGLAIGDITWEYSDTVLYKCVISTDPCYCHDVECGSEVNMVISDGSDCYVGQADYAEWTKAGRPICWCYSRQCKGDADGLSQGKENYWVGTNDLTILRSAWQITNGPVGPGACADFDHLTQGKENYRVSSNDLTILRTYWQMTNGPTGSCLPGNKTP
jgi:hypothetical protein